MSVMNLKIRSRRFISELASRGLSECLRSMFVEKAGIKMKTVMDEQGGGPDKLEPRYPSGAREDTS